MPRKPRRSFTAERKAALPRRHPPRHLLARPHRHHRQRHQRRVVEHDITDPRMHPRIPKQLRRSLAYQLQHHSRHADTCRQAA